MLRGGECDVKFSAQESYGIGDSLKLTDEERPSTGRSTDRGAIVCNAGAIPLLQQVPIR